MKKKQPNELSLPAALEEWHETEQSTIIDAFVYLTRDTESKGSLRPHREMTLDTSDNEALHYLMRRLNLTAIQVHILACALFHNQATGHACDTDDITGYVGCHPLMLFSRKEELKTLVISAQINGLYARRHLLPLAITDPSISHRCVHPILLRS